VTARLGAIGVFFALRIGCALILLKLAASRLSVAGFADFSQYLAFASLVTLLAVGGTQNGLIRQVAAARSHGELEETLAAAAAIWIAASGLLIIIALVAAHSIGVVLVGHTRESAAIVALTLAAILAGPGQIRCSMLSGQGRMISSLAVQSVGLLAGAAGAAVFAVRGNGTLAAFAFACGSIVPSLPVLPLALRPLVRPPLAALAGEARQLLRYSLAFGTVAAATPLTFFALRWQYRADFGGDALGRWLSANRISDLSTQLIGLFILQVFVPHVARLTDPAARRRFTLVCGAGGMAAMALPLIAFSVAAEPLVRLFLSPSFLPAIPAIRTYMAGDMLRVWTSIGIYTAFAAGKAERYAALELTVLGSIAALSLVMMGHGYASAPQWAYFATHAAFSAGFMMLVLFSWRSLAASRTADTASLTSKISARHL
jgi:O-antigen/teichoic acid export membrane protein